jgi:primosomal replication protein N
VKRNQLLLDAEILDIGPLRMTPGGIETVSLKLGHQSMQVEAEREREVRVSLEAAGFGAVARKLGLLKAGSRIAIKGFLARKGVNSEYPILHVNEFKTIE